MLFLAQVWGLYLGLLTQTPERPTAQESHEPVQWWHREPLALSTIHTEPLLCLPSFIEATGPRSPQAGTQVQVFFSSIAFGAHRAHKTKGEQKRPSWMRGARTPSNNTWGTEAPSRLMAGEGPVSFFLAPAPLTVEFLVHDPQGGEEIAKEEDEEREAAHEHLGEESG